MQISPLSRPENLSSYPVSRLNDDEDDWLGP